MTDSILDTIKKMLGIPTTDTAFDEDILVNINSAFMTLNQLGIGPDTVFSVPDSSTLWSQFLVDPSLYPQMKSYVYLFVKEIFDPPTNGSVLASMQKVRGELEWRLSVQVPTSTV